VLLQNPSRQHAVINAPVDPNSVISLSYCPVAAFPMFELVGIHIRWFRDLLDVHSHYGLLAR